MTFLVDTGTQHSVLTRSPGTLSSRTAWVQGATGGKTYHWTTNRQVQLVTGKVTYPLLGRDLLKAQIHFEKTGANITDPSGKPLHVLTLSIEDEYRLHEQDKKAPTDMEEWLLKYPQAWAETGGHGSRR